MGLAVSQSVVVVLSLVPVAGSHLSELIMCDKTGMAEGTREGGRKQPPTDSLTLYATTTIFALRYLFSPLLQPTCLSIQL